MAPLSVQTNATAMWLEARSRLPFPRVWEQRPEPQAWHGSVSPACPRVQWRQDKLATLFLNPGSAEVGPLSPSQQPRWGWGRPCPPSRTLAPLSHPGRPASAGSDFTAARSFARTWKQVFCFPHVGWESCLLRAPSPRAGGQFMFVHVTQNYLTSLTPGLLLPLPGPRGCHISPQLLFQRRGGTVREQRQNRWRGTGTAHSQCHEHLGTKSVLWVSEQKACPQAHHSQQSVSEATGETGREGTKRSWRGWGGGAVREGTPWVLERWGERTHTEPLNQKCGFQSLPHRIPAASPTEPEFLHLTTAANT